MIRLEIQFQNLRFIHIFTKWVKGLHTKDVDIFITHFEKKILVPNMTHFEKIQSSLP